MPDHALRAVRTALDIRAALDAFHRQLEPRFRLNVNFGINSGRAIVGNVGAPEIMARTQFVASRTYQHLPLYITAGLLYFVLTWLGVAGLKALERKVRIPGYTQHGMQ